mmetsp:Transcript_6413/g.13979  ORF Transcript_6413/g.13979 Transcript_6413/m.13979 type:complete len:321 (-) Transcript_6413:93-1055(-)
MKVLLCGGGDAIHALAAHTSAKPDVHVTILSLFPGEAGQLRDAIPDEGVQCVNELGEGLVRGKPDAVIDNAEHVPTDLDIVIFAMPSFAQEFYLRALKPHLKPGVSIGTMSGGCGFDFCVSQNLGLELVQNSDIFAIETLPWAWRTEEEVEVLISPKYGATKEGFVTNVLYNLFGRFPVSKPATNVFAVSLLSVDSNSVQRVDQCTGDELAKFSGEQIKSKRFLHEGYQSVHPGPLHLESESMTLSHGDYMDSKENIDNMIRTRKVCRGPENPKREVEVNEEKRCLPNFKCRYFLDVPIRRRRRCRNIQACRRNPTSHNI